ncbi:hypothetical protein EV715DRAFT_297609 [Schizophyllum commune]
MPPSLPQFLSSPLLNHMLTPSISLDRQLPPLLAEAGLRVVAEDKVTIPVGRMVGEMLGGGVDARAKEGGKGEEGENLDAAPPPLPPLSPTDLRTIEGATSKMFGHFVGMMREAWVEGCLRDYDG